MASEYILFSLTVGLKKIPAVPADTDCREARRREALAGIYLLLV